MDQLVTLCLVCNLIKILSCDDDRNNLDVVNVKVDVVIGKRYYCQTTFSGFLLVITQ